MLLAKISPAVQWTVNNGPFNPPTVLNLEYMSCHVAGYKIGVEPVTFIFKFGTATINPDGTYKNFVPKMIQQYNLSSPQLDNWGTNDQYIFNTYATDKNFSILSFHNPE